jgi:F-type H+-transporting ATPase subunit delta
MKVNAQTRGQAKHLYRLCLVNGTLDESRVRQVIQNVLQSRRRGYLVLLAQFHRLLRLDHSRHTAEIESAESLTADLRASIEAGLEAVYGPGINTLFVPNPTLIGGMRIKVGSDVYDGSVRAGLVELEERF